MRYTLFPFLTSVLLFGFVIGCTLRVPAETVNPPPGRLFCDTVVPRIDITIDPETLEWIYDNPDSNQEFNALFVFSDGNAVDTIHDIGFRLRGNTSRYAPKKSFKVSFNTFVSGRKFEGVEKLNLNGEHNDPSVIRAKLCWDLLRASNLPAARCNHMQLYINGNYHGLYLNVEHIDEEFVLSRFGNKNGNLYKCLYPADLDYLGSNPNLYKYQIYGRRPYDLKTNKAADDYTGLAHFVDVLNNSNPQNFFCNMEEVFNIYDYLQIAAIDVLTGNWDGYIYNKNNFYLYHNTATGRFEYIPYDIDNTIGIDWIGRDWGTRDIYDWAQHGNEKRPLYNNIMNDQRLRDQYSYYMNRLLPHFTDTSLFYNRIFEIRDRILPYVETDPYYPLNYGYTVQDFLDSYYNGIGGHAPYGLTEFLETRRNSASQQLNLNDVFPVVRNLTYNYPQQGDDFRVTALADAGTVMMMELVCSLNGEPIQYVAMFDDGQHYDGEAGDDVYGAVIPDIPSNAHLLFYVSATGNQGKITHLPCEPVSIQMLPAEDYGLVVNEFMASNATTIADEYDEYDDWIEIYNGGDVDVWLGDKYLSDRFDNQTKYQFPDITLSPGEFYLVWADNDPEQGNNHAGFRLDKEGEKVGLFDSPNTGYAVIDTITYGPQQIDISFGRSLDGGGEWVFFVNPTPGASNHQSSVVLQKEGLHLRIYPNPVENEVIRFSHEISFDLYTSDGRRAAGASDVTSFSLAGLEPGMYLLVVKGWGTTKLLIP